MKKIAFFLSIFLVSTLFFVSVEAATAKQAEFSAMLKNESLGIPDADRRLEALKKFLDNYRSPLAPYAGVFIEIADKYDVDWKLVPAITGVESTFGRNIPFNSYNAYGWCNGDYSFKSWEESIEIVTSTLRNKYINRGLDTPYKIGPVYAPPSTTWAGKVNFFMKKIDCLYKESYFTSLDLTI